MAGCSDLRRDIPSKVCFVKFTDESSTATSLHLTNTIFIDRALIVARSRYGEPSVLINAHPVQLYHVVMLNICVVCGALFSN